MSGPFKVGGVTADIDLNANPAIAALAKAKKAADSFAETGKETGNVLTQAMDSAKRAVVGYDAALSAGKRALSDLTAGVDNLGRKKLEITGRIGEFHGWIEKSKQSVDELNRKISQGATTKSTLADLYKGLDAGITQSRKSVDELTSRLKAQRELLAKPIEGQDNVALKASIKSTTAELNEMKRALNAQEVNRSSVARAMRGIEIEAKRASASVKKLDQDMAFNTGQIDRAEKEIVQLDRALENAATDAQRLKSELREIAVSRSVADANSVNTGRSAGLGLMAMAKSEAVSYGMGFLAVGAAAETMRRVVTSSVAASIRASMELEVAQVELAKTVDGTDAELQEMTQQLIDISLRTPFSANNLLRDAGMGAQLGIAKENLVDFAETVEKVQIATDLTAEEGATGFAQWANITQMAQGKIKNLANVVVDLGQNSAATEKGILGMGLRIASAADSVGFLDHETAALAATLKSLGLEDEMGGTAASRMLTDISKAVATGGDQLELFSRVSGKTVEKFVSDWKQGPANAFRDVFTGLQKFRDQGGNMFLLAESMGFEDQRVGDTLRRMAGGAALFEASLVRANAAIGNTSALDAEAARFSATFASSVAELNNAFTDLKATLGDLVTDELETFLEMSAAIVSGVSALEKSTGLISTAARGAATNLIPGGGSAGLSGALDLFSYLSQWRQAQEVATEQASLLTEVEAGLQQLQDTYISRSRARAAESVAASDAEKQGFKELGEMIKGGLSKELKAAADAGDELWRKLRPSEDLFYSAVKGLESLKAAGKLDDESANLLGRMLWQELGEKSVDEINKAIGKLQELKGSAVSTISGIQEALIDELGDELDRQRGDAADRRYDRERKSRQEARKEAERAAKEEEERRNREEDERQQDFQNAWREANALEAAQNELRYKLELYTERGLASEAGGQGALFYEHYKGKPEIIWSVVRALEAEVRQRDELAEAARSALPAILGLIDADERAAEQRREKESAKSELSATERPEIQQEKDRVNALQGVASELNSIGSTVGGISKEFVAVNTATKLASVGVNVFAKVSSIAATETRLSWESALGVFGLVLEGIYQMTSAMGLFGDETEKEAKGVDKVFEEVGDNIDGWIDDLSSQLVEFFETGEGSASDFVKSVLREIAKITTAELIVQPVVDFGGDMLGFAKGGVFDQYKNVVPFAKGGHVTHGPEFFQMGGGRMGVRGEAGPEAVVPLERMRDGKLGVNTMAAGGGQVVNIIDNRIGGGSLPVRTETVMRGGRSELDIYIENAVEGALNRGRFDRPLARNHGIRRVGG